MRNIRLSLEYCGKNYSGWQVQKRTEYGVGSRELKTIQGTIERALRQILRERVGLVGSGRTDAGVHALAQSANFKTHSGISLTKLRLALNSLLPGDIRVTRIEEARLGFHSRFQAKSKTYRYLILNRPCPSVFLRDYVYFYSFPLNLKLMQKEAVCLLGRHDFKAFCASAGSAKDTVRKVKKITVKKVSDKLVRLALIVIEIEADGFLYNMARNIVGTLIEIGRGKFPEGSLKKILLSRKRKLAGPTAPACGLCLIKVKY